MDHKRTGKISSTSEEEYNDESNPIEDIIDRLNNCRLNYYKLYKKNSDGKSKKRN